MGPTDSPPRPVGAILTHYEVLGVSATCSPGELRAAYREQARILHPDVAPVDDGGAAMARLNLAWQVLSIAESRNRYDQSLAAVQPSATSPSSTSPSSTPPAQAANTAASGAAWSSMARDDRQPAPKSARSRRQAWVRGVQAQILRLSRLAGRSASQAMLVRSNRAPRATYEALLEEIVAGLTEETEARVRAARAAGAAPLDLAVGATLIGLQALAEDRRRRKGTGPTQDDLLSAEMIDRMWDILAHELTRPLIVALGGNPQLRQSLTRR